MRSCKLFGSALWAVAFLVACETPDGGSGSPSSVSYYGTGYSDMWYYGDSYYPPPDSIRPPPDQAPRPSHPIATPPGSNLGPRPMPTIPSMPRVAPRGR